MKKFYPASIATTALALFGSIVGNAILPTSAVPAYTAELYHDLPLAVENSTVSGFVQAFDRLLFIHDTKLWSLGPDGVTEVDEVRGAWSNFGEGETSTALLDDTLYFFAGDDENSLRLMKTDGSAAGTFRVRHILINR